VEGFVSEDSAASSAISGAFRGTWGGTRFLKGFGTAMKDRKHLF